MISEYPFRRDFQLRLLSLLLRRTPEVEVRTTISAEYFSGPIHTDIARWILEAYEKHPNDRLSQASLLSVAKANLGRKRADIWPEYRRIIKQLFSLKPTDDDFMLSKVADFVKEEDFRNTLVEAEQDLNAGRFDKYRKRFDDLASKHEPPTEQQYGHDWPTPLGDDALHGLVGEIVRTIEPCTEADPAGLLIQLLVGFGNAVGRNACFQIGATRQYTNLFTVLVGRTAKSRKETAWREIRPFLADADENWNKKCVVLGGLGSGEMLVHLVRDPVEKMVPSKEHKGKLEKVTIDPGVEDKRLLLVNSEFSAAIKVMQRPENILSENVRQAFDSGDLNNLSKISSARATDTHISIVGHCTQGETLKLLGRLESGNGFANRFLWTCVTRSKELSNPQPINRETKARLVSKIVRAIQFAKTPRVIKRSPKAEALWSAIYKQLCADEAPGLLGEITARGPVQVMRLALIYALSDMNPVIQRKHMKAALAVWKYCESSARFIFGDALGYPDAERLLKALQNAPDGLSRAQISAQVFSHNKPKRDIDAALKHLKDRGLIDRKSLETEGRTRELWQVRSTKVTKETKDDLPPSPVPGVIYRFSRS